MEGRRGFVMGRKRWRIKPGSLEQENMFRLGALSRELHRSIAAVPCKIKNGVV